MITDCRQLPSSKSIANRILICRAFEPQLSIQWNFPGSDVSFLERCIYDLSNGKKEFLCGDGATTFRFFATLLTRFPGEYAIKIDPQLRGRPQNDLEDLFQQSSTLFSWDENTLYVNSKNSLWPEQIYINLSQTSQLLSAGLLCSWNLDKDITFHLTEKKVSPAYYHMTLNLLKEMQLKCQVSEDSITVFKKQKIEPVCYNIEPDMGCLFAVIALGLYSNKFQFLNLPLKSLQPDFFSHKILSDMGVSFSTKDNITSLKVPDKLKPVTVNLNSTPDLFPILSVLCSFIDGDSYLFGAEHLAYKETNRLQTTGELLSLIGKDFELLKDGIRVFGSTTKKNISQENFNSHNDHRLVMAAEVANSFGTNIEVLDPEAVNKSFPNFYDYVKEVRL